MLGLRKRTPFYGDFQKRWTCRDCGEPEVVYMRRPSVDRPECCQHCGSEDLALMIGRFVYRSFAAQRPLRWETLREAGGKGSVPAHREPAATPAPPPKRRDINVNPNPAPPGPPPVVQTRPSPTAAADPDPCPCGSTALRAKWDSAAGAGWLDCVGWIHCDRCGRASTPVALTEGRERLIAQWNREVSA